MKRLFFLLLVPYLLFAQEDLTPEQIEQQLDEAENQFKKAKEMFNPWYAGPLITGGAHNMPPNYIGIQPYLFMTDNYARFNNDRHSVSIPTLFQLNPQISYQTGITDQLDITLAQSALLGWQSGHYGSGLGDTGVTLGFQLIKEGIYVPAMKLGIAESFPTGSYDNLSEGANGLDGTGAGVYLTSLSFRIAKLLLWSTQHPLNLRGTFTFTFPNTRASIHNFSAYGGTFGTRGKVRPGNQYNISIGMEWSFTQRWVFANDFVFVHNNKTKFVGQTTVPIGGLSNEQFSLAPAIEYNPTPNLNFLGGVWFTVTGRNSLNFLSAVISVAYTFKVK